jgi:hypothetical protein
MMLTLNSAYAPRAAARLVEQIRAQQQQAKKPAPDQEQPTTFTIHIPPGDGSAAPCRPDQFPCVLVNNNNNNNNNNACLFNLHMRACYPKVPMIYLPALPVVRCCVICDGLRSGRIKFLDVGISTDGRVVVVVL